MTKFSVTRDVPFSADQVFAIARDVEHYKGFLPLVKESSVSHLKKLPDGRTRFEAHLRISYQKLGINETMRSEVVVDETTRTVTAVSSEGPVKQLNSEWKFVDVPGGAQIQFTVDYTLKSRTLQFLLSGMFDMMVRRIMTAFEERARKLYGSARVA